MNRPKWDVLWSPFYSDRFITWDSDTVLSLYEIGPLEDSTRDSDQICKYQTYEINLLFIDLQTSLTFCYFY